MLWSSVDRWTVVGDCTVHVRAHPSAWQVPPAFSGGWGVPLFHDLPLLYVIALFFLVYCLISADSILQLILEITFQFLPKGLAKYRILSRGSFLLQMFKDTSALCLIAIVDGPESILIFDSLVCDLSPNPRAIKSGIFLSVPWKRTGPCYGKCTGPCWACAVSFTHVEHALSLSPMLGMRRLFQCTALLMPLS